MMGRVVVSVVVKTTQPGLNDFRSRFRWPFDARWVRPRRWMRPWD